jgi:hypothetical protein
LDSWRGVGDIIAGLNVQCHDMELRQSHEAAATIWRLLDLLTVGLLDALDPPCVFLSLPTAA